MSYYISVKLRSFCLLWEKCIILDRFGNGIFIAICVDLLALALYLVSHSCF